MSTKKKLLKKIMSGAHDRNVTFEEFRLFLSLLGYSVRTGKGSHHIVSHPNVEGILNIQPKKDGTAKGYQLDQARDQIKKYGLDRE